MAGSRATVIPAGWLQGLVSALRARYLPLGIPSERILNFAGEGVYTTDELGAVTFVNIAAARMLRTDVHLLLGRNIHELCHVDNPDRPLCPVCTPLAAGHDPEVDDQMFVRADGTSFPVEFTSTSLYESGEVVRIVTFKDVTERKRAETALRQSELKFRSVAESANDALVSADPHGNIVAWNRGAELMFGYKEDEVLGQPLTILMPEGYRDAHRAGISHFQMTGEARVVGKTVEVEGQRKDGSTFPLELSLAHWERDERQYFTGIIRDITERKEADAALQREVAFVQLLQSIALAANTASNSYEVLEFAVGRVCEHTGWPIGHVYLVDEDSEFPLQPSEIWNPESRQRFRDFCEVTRNTPLRRGEGLPGRVLTSKKPIWITNVATDDNFPRHAVAGRLGIGAGVAFPVMVGEDVAAVLEFFTGTVREPDHVLVEVMGQVGTQLGRVIERERAEDRLTHHAMHDPLTGLPNRSLFQDRLRAALDSTTGGDVVAVLFLDLDRFKMINDSLGHKEGDEVLLAVAHRLREIMRPSDTLARFGGDEFVLVAEGLSDAEHAVALAQRIVEAMSAPFDLGETEVFLTTSIGIAIAEGPDPEPYELLRDADSALYRAKDHGRGRWELFTEAMRSEALDRLQTVNDLHRAIERGELELYYQPQVALDHSAVTGMEALARWHHPERGVVLPQQFIPLAEETGLIVSLGRWVLRQACQQARRWKDQYDWAASMSMSVNISPRQLQQPHLVEDVAIALAEAGLEPSSLTLEITESLAVQDLDATVTRLTQLKSLGVRLAIDDFGTGYSYLGYLRQLPIDELKIDKSFIDGLGGSSYQSAVAETIVRLAQTLHLTTVAEGVEQIEQVDALRTMACNVAQGFYFAHPLPARVVEDALCAHVDAGARIEAIGHAWTNPATEFDPPSASLRATA